MKISKTDPRLTAYAFGEIDDTNERTEIEQAIAADPELQAEVENIRSMALCSKPDWMSKPYPSSVSLTRQGWSNPPCLKRRLRPCVG